MFAHPYSCLSAQTHTHLYIYIYVCVCVYVCMYTFSKGSFYHVFESPIPCFIITLLLVLTWWTVPVTWKCSILKSTLHKEASSLEAGGAGHGKKGLGEEQDERGVSFSKWAALFNSRGYMLVRISESGIHFGPELHFLLSFHRVFWWI